LNARYGANATAADLILLVSLYSEGADSAMPDPLTIQNTRSSLARRVTVAALIAALTCLLAQQTTVADDQDGTLYEITAQLLKPPLGETPPYNIGHERRCLTRWQLHGFFPILTHPALAMCHVGAKTEHDDKLNFPLECGSEHRTTGMIAWKMRGRAIVGRLYARSAATTMRFSQKVVATPIEPCFLYANFL